MQAANADVASFAYDIDAPEIPQLHGQKLLAKGGAQDFLARMDVIARLYRAPKQEVKHIVMTAEAPFERSTSGEMARCMRDNADAW